MFFLPAVPHGGGDIPRNSVETCRIFPLNVEFNAPFNIPLTGVWANWGVCA